MVRTAIPVFCEMFWRTTNARYAFIAAMVRISSPQLEFGLLLKTGPTFRGPLQAAPLITKEQSAGGEFGSFSRYISQRVGRVAGVSLYRKDANHVGHVDSDAEPDWRSDC